MAYYYLVASLPSLELDAKLPWTTGQFLAACENSLEPEDLAEVKLALEGLEARSGHPLLRQWHWRDTQLRNAAAGQRAAKLGMESAPSQREHAGFDVGIERGVSEAMRAPNPLEREKALDLLRWAMASDLATAEPFGLGAVIGHALQLRLASRWQDMTEQEGRQTLSALLETGLKKMGRTAGRDLGGAI